MPFQDAMPDRDSGVFGDSARSERDRTGSYRGLHSHRWIQRIQIRRVDRVREARKLKQMRRLGVIAVDQSTKCDALRSCGTRTTGATLKGERIKWKIRNSV